MSTEIYSLLYFLKYSKMEIGASCHTGSCHKGYNILVKSPIAKKNVSSEFICWFLFQNSLIQLAVILLLLLQMAKTINNLFVLSLLVLVFIVLCFRIVVLFKFSPKAYNTTVLNQRPWETSKGVAKFFKIRQSMH